MTNNALSAIDWQPRFRPPASRRGQGRKRFRLPCGPLPPPVSCIFAQTFSGDASPLGREMNGWSREDAIAMERRHILEGEERVARQEALVGKLIGAKRDQLAFRANELLGVMRDTLELSRIHLRAL